MEKLTLLALFVGAMLSHLASEAVKRAFAFFFDSAKEQRSEQCREICAIIENLQAHSEELWSQNADQLLEREAILCARILGDVDALTELASDALSGEKKREADLLIMAVSKAVSGGSFQTPNRMASSDTLIDTRISCGKLLRFVKKKLG
jgi:hypothetical protein